jgi:hypothetical protein
LITAKVKCASKTETGDNEARQAVVSFQPDYADGRNKEWAMATPTLSFQMTLNGSKADLVELGQAYTLQLVKNDE